MNQKPLTRLQKHKNLKIQKMILETCITQPNCTANEMPSTKSAKQPYQISRNKPKESAPEAEPVINCVWNKCFAQQDEYFWPLCVPAVSKLIVNYVPTWPFPFMAIQPLSIIL